MREDKEIQKEEEGGGGRGEGKEVEEEEERISAGLRAKDQGLSISRLSGLGMTARHRPWHPHHHH